MTITAKIDRLVQKGNIKAIASVSLDGMFVVKGLKVMDGRKGLFVSMPQESFAGQDGQKKYSNLFFALTNAAKTELQDAVLQAYQQQMGQGYGHGQNYGRNPDHSGGQYRQGQYPNQYQQTYPEPGYRNQDWAGDYDDILPMDLR
ncbi:MAG: SpoVG family protein [Oscillospiraceae bacterium]|nr:SpoVG family protein [Oscillospiraceae bacterium]